jgi:hypothetical protein
MADMAVNEQYNSARISPPIRQTPKRTRLLAELWKDSGGITWGSNTFQWQKGTL